MRIFGTSFGIFVNIQFLTFVGPTVQACRSSDFFTVCILRVVMLFSPPEKPNFLLLLLATKVTIAKCTLALLSKKIAALSSRNKQASYSAQKVHHQHQQKKTFAFGCAQMQHLDRAPSCLAFGFLFTTRTTEAELALRSSTCV